MSLEREQVSSPFDDIISGHQNRLRRAGSALVILVLFTFLLVGLFGLTETGSTKEVSVNGAVFDIQYPSTIRAGNEIQLTLKFDSGRTVAETMTVRLNKDYLALFENMDVYPTPEAETTDGKGNVEFFFTPNSTAATVKFIGQASDQWELKTPADIDIAVGGKHQQVEFTTWRIP